MGRKFKVVEAQGGYISRQVWQEWKSSVSEAVRVSPHKKLCPSDLVLAGTADAPFQTAGEGQLDGPGGEGRRVWCWLSVYQPSSILSSWLFSQTPFLLDLGLAVTQS